jgi:hypothetical protein
MRIYLDLDARRFFSTITRSLSRLEFKRRDNDAFEVQFLRAGIVQELPAGTVARVGLKATEDYAGDFLATDTLSKSGTGTDTVYKGDFNLNTAPLEGLFASEPDSITAMLELQWMSGTQVGSSLTLPVTIFNDVIRGDEGAPANLPLFYTSETSDFLATQAEAEAGSDNTKWMSPLRTAQAITALASTGSHTHPLSDLTQSSATTGQVPTWNGTNWVPQTPSGGGGGGGVSSWNDLTDKPSTFPPEAHTHAIADTTGLEAALDSKQAAGSYAAATHTHDAASITSGTIAVARIPTGTTSSTVALGNHTHTFGTTAGTFCQGNDSRLSTPTSHTHGNITNAGAIGTTSGVPVITGTSGVLQAGSFGTAAGTFAQGNHTHGNITNAGAIGTAASLPIITGTSGVLQAGSFGTTAGTFCQGNDSRLLNISGGLTAISVVATMPATPNSSTLYIVTG